MEILILRNSTRSVTLNDSFSALLRVCVPMFVLVCQLLLCPRSSKDRFNLAKNWSSSAKKTGILFMVCLFSYVPDRE